MAIKEEERQEFKETHVENGTNNTDTNVRTGLRNDAFEMQQESHIDDTVMKDELLAARNRGDVTRVRELIGEGESEDAKRPDINNGVKAVLRETEEIRDEKDKEKKKHDEELQQQSPAQQEAPSNKDQLMSFFMDPLGLSGEGVKEEPKSSKSYAMSAEGLAEAIRDGDMAAAGAIMDRLQRLEQNTGKDHTGDGEVSGHGPAHGHDEYGGYYGYRTDGSWYYEDRFGGTYDQYGYNDANNVFHGYGDVELDRKTGEVTLNGEVFETEVDYGSDVTEDGAKAYSVLKREQTGIGAEHSVDAEAASKQAGGALGTASSELNTPEQEARQLEGAMAASEEEKARGNAPLSQQAPSVIESKINNKVLELAIMRATDPAKAAEIDARRGELRPGETWATARERISKAHTEMNVEANKKLDEALSGRTPAERTKLRAMLADPHQQEAAFREIFGRDMPQAGIAHARQEVLQQNKNLDNYTTAVKAAKAQIAPDGEKGAGYREAREAVLASSSKEDAAAYSSFKYVRDTDALEDYVEKDKQIDSELNAIRGAAATDITKGPWFEDQYGYWSPDGGYYQKGGDGYWTDDGWYRNSQGEWHDVDGGVYKPVTDAEGKTVYNYEDKYGGTQFASGAYQDANYNYVDKDGNLWTGDNFDAEPSYKQSDYPDRDFKAEMKAAAAAGKTWSIDWDKQQAAPAVAQVAPAPTEAPVAPVAVQFKTPTSSPDATSLDNISLASTTLNSTQSPAYSSFLGGKVSDYSFTNLATRAANNDSAFVNMSSTNFSTDAPDVYGSMFFSNPGRFPAPYSGISSDPTVIDPAKPTFKASAPMLA